MGDPTPRVSIALNFEDPSSIYAFSPLKRGLGKTRNYIKLPGYTTKKIKSIDVGKQVFSILEHKQGTFISKYFLSKNLITGYILHDALPVTYHSDEIFLQQIESFPNDCHEYLQSKAISSTQRFDCYAQAHDGYIEEYIFEVLHDPPFFGRFLVVDAFYPVALKQNATREINRIVDEIISE